MENASSKYGFREKSSKEKLSQEKQEISLTEFKEKLSPKKLYDLFVTRSDRIAFQRPDGNYAGNVKTSEKGWLEYLKRHISGNLTVGSYALNEEDKAKWLCLDIDCKKDVKKAKDICDLLSFYLASDLNLPHSVEFSGGKGYHIWLFFEELAEAAILRKFAHWFLGKHASFLKINQSEYTTFIQNTKINVEIYPKQDKSNGVGSLVKLPLGTHRLTGKKSEFVRFTDEPVELETLVSYSESLYETEKEDEQKTEKKTGKKIILPESPGEWNVYRALKELCKKEETIKVPLKRLAEHTGYTRQTAAKWMHNLSTKGLINARLETTDTFKVFRPKYNRETKLIKREYFISVQDLPADYNKFNQTDTSSTINNQQPSFKINAPYRTDRNPSLVYLPRIGLWKDYATGQIFKREDPVLKNCTPKT